MGTADPGYNGGGTVMANDPHSMMTNYENIFGPAVRDIKWDEQRHKRHQRWHLPDALKGTNAFLTDRVDGLITDSTSSPFTKNILPYMYMDQPDKKIKWNVYSFDEGIASRVPYEAAARVLPQSKRSFAGYAVRQGLAIAMEHNFMMSPQGMDNFRKQLMQLVGSIQLTNDLDVHMALLYAPSYQKHMDEKYYDTSRSVSQNCRMYVDLFGFMQKNENALDYLIEDAKNHLTSWGSKPPTFMLCNGSLTRQLTMTPEKTNYITAGPDGKRKLAQGPDLPSYRGLSFINTRQFSLEAGTAPRDMLRRRVRVSEHYRIPWETNNLLKRYEFYDQSRDSMFYHSWLNLWKASFPPTAQDLNLFMRGDKRYERSLMKTLNYDTHAAIIENDLNKDFSTWLSLEEQYLAMMMGIFDCGPSVGGQNNYPMIIRSLDFVVQTYQKCEDKARVKTVSFQVKKQQHALRYFFYLIILKQFLRDNFQQTHERDDETEEEWKNSKIRVLQHLVDFKPIFSERATQILNNFTHRVDADGILIEDEEDNEVDAAAQNADGQQNGNGVADAGNAGGNQANALIEHNSVIKLRFQIQRHVDDASAADNLSHFLFDFQQAVDKWKKIKHYYNRVLEIARSDSMINEHDKNTLSEAYTADNIEDLLPHYSFQKEDTVACIASDLLIFRPCIEHYMLGVIMGRGGGPEELGATFWGQTELSCYDDSQHGIWGMSYKYHERAIVTNERNLIRVYDICFDGYCGGNDSTILQWSRDALEDFKAKSSGLNEAYTGPSMLIMSLPPDSNPLRAFPNPMIFHTKVHTQPSAVPDRNLRSNNYDAHIPFLMTDDPSTQTKIYDYYYRAAGLDSWSQSHQSAGHLAYQNETDPYMYSFQGHMATILDGHREEIQGSGHLGPNFVGVASVREGRGMMPRGMPTLAHLV
jgi:hypothetical protein